MIVGPVAWEWVAFVVALAVCGVVAVGWQAMAGIRQARDWWQAQRARHRRGQPAGVSDDCWFNAHEDCDGCDCNLCDCREPLEIDPLPPERSREELGFTGGPRSLMGLAERAFWSELEEFGPHGMLRPERERRAPWWEAEHRAAYESLGFDYPSGLMARVREAAP